MKDSMKKRILERDKGICWHCGDTESNTIHHRINRGMGGSKLLDRPSNLVTMCVEHNGLMESDLVIMIAAKELGWKVSRHANPLVTPIRDYMGQWWLLGDMYEKWETDERHQTDNQAD